MSAKEILGYACFTASAVFWLLAYLLIIRRGFIDRSYGMPLVALGANLSWEFIIAFIYPPLPLFARLCVIAWFLLDIPLALQCVRYARQEFKHPWARRYAGPILLFTGGACFAIVLGFIDEFGDFRGWYSGFGINLMMSILFIDMLIRRDNVRGQSIPIAILKLLGTLCAFLWACFWSPVDILTPLTEIVPAQTYPVAPLIVVLYAVTLVLDILYILLVRGKCIDQGIDPWRRI